MDAETEEKASKFAMALMSMMAQFRNTFPPSREASMVVTKLDEAILWTGAMVAGPFVKGAE